MNSYKVIFTIRQSIHPLTETVQALTVEAAKMVVLQKIVEARLTLKQIVSVIQQ